MAELDYGSLVDEKLVTWVDGRGKERVKRSIPAMLSKLRLVGPGEFEFRSLIDSQPYVFIIATSITMLEIDDPIVVRDMVLGAACDLRESHTGDVVGNVGTLEEFRGYLAARARKFLSQPRSTYHVVLPLFVDSAAFRGRTIQLCGIRLNFRTWTTLSKTYDLEAWEHATEEEIDRSPVFVEVGVEARDAREAFWIANAAFGLLQACLNLLVCSRRRNWNSLGVLREPIAAVTTGRYCAVFDARRKFKLYYELKYPTAVESVRLDTSIDAKRVRLDDNLWAATRKILRPFRHLPRKNETIGIVAEAIDQYGAAIVGMDEEKVFLSLWQVLERLTFRGAERFDMNAVCTRIGALLGKETLRTDVLAAAQQVRNDLVHKGNFSASGQLDVELLRWVVEQSIVALLSLVETYPTWSELVLFYDYAPGQPRDRTLRAKVLKSIEQLENRGRRKT